jgi:hypothetical protein
MRAIAFLFLGILLFFSLVPAWSCETLLRVQDLDEFAGQVSLCEETSGSVELRVARTGKNLRTLVLPKKSFRAYEAGIKKGREEFLAIEAGSSKDPIRCLHPIQVTFNPKDKKQESFQACRETKAYQVAQRLHHLIVDLSFEK